MRTSRTPARLDSSGVASGRERPERCGIACFEPESLIRTSIGEVAAMESRQDEKYYAIWFPLAGDSLGECLGSLTLRVLCNKIWLPDRTGILNSYYTAN